MAKTMIFLILAYSLSQFYRACLSVFAPALKADIGMTADQVSTALGLWFLLFATMQIPVGWLLDNKSPRTTAALLLAFGAGGGAFLFAAAQSATGVYVAMMMIGIGCSPVLMTSFYIFARTAPSHIFGTLAGLIVGIGSLGNLAASAPLSYFLELVGWRNTAVGLGVITVLVASMLYIFLTDPPKVEVSEEEKRGGLKDLLSNWTMYPVLAIALVNYAPSAAIRGSWGGAYLAEIFNMDVSEIGRATAYMAIAMICGSLAFGPIDRIVPSRKLIVMTGVSITVTLFVTLWWTAGSASALTTTLLFVGIGFFGSTYGQVMNHGRSLTPVHLTGRGVTLINLFSMGGASLAQISTGYIFAASSEHSTTVHGPYAAVFAFLTCGLIVGLIIYAFSREPK